MTMTFNLFCTEHQLSPSYENEEKLKTIESWCYNNISKDIRYTGALSKQYEQYLALAKNYLDGFLPYVSDNLESQVPQFEGLNPIQFAAKSGYDYFISIQSSPPVNAFNAANKNMMTPLHVSASIGYRHTVERLLTKGADAQIKNNQNQNPLYQALFLPIQYDPSLKQTKEAIFRLLLDHKAEAGWMDQDNKGDTVLHLMIVNGFERLVNEVIRRAPQLVFTRNNASRYPIHMAILNNQLIIAGLLLEITGVAALVDGQKRLALHYAARHGTADMVQQCIKATSDVNVRDSAFKTPLLMAAEAGNLDAVKCLLEHGANAQDRDLEGSSILHVAVNTQNIELTRWLLENGSHELVNLTDIKGNIPLYYAHLHNNTVLEELFAASSCKPN